MKLLVGSLALLFCCAVELPAGVITLTLPPSTPGASNVVGGSSNAPGFPSSSWAAPGVGKSEWYLPANALFAGAVRINDIQSISYWTNKAGNGGAPDWSFYLYTARTNDGTDTGSFYHSRLTSEPYLTNSTVAPNTWHEWSTGDATNPMRFYDSNRNGGIFGTYTDPTLAALQGGAISWPGGQTYNYGNDIVSLFSLQTGSAWANGFTGQVDGLTITLKNGDIGIVNFEAQITPTAVPEPASLLVWSIIGGAAVFGYRRKRAARVS